MDIEELDKPILEETPPPSGGGDLLITVVLVSGFTILVGLVIIAALIKPLSI